jgi:hypothetical protein
MTPLHSSCDARLVRPIGCRPGDISMCYRARQLPRPLSRALHSGPRPPLVSGAEAPLADDTPPVLVRYPRIPHHCMCWECLVAETLGSRWACCRREGLALDQLLASVRSGGKWAGSMVIRHRRHRSPSSPSWSICRLQPWHGSRARQHRIGISSP